MSDSQRVILLLVLPKSSCYCSVSTSFDLQSERDRGVVAESTSKSEEKYESFAFLTEMDGGVRRVVSTVRSEEGVVPLGNPKERQCSAKETEADGAEVPEWTEDTDERREEEREMEESLEVSEREGQPTRVE